MPGADRNALAAHGAAAAEHGGTGLGLHALPKAVRFHPATAVRLKCAFGHRDPLLYFQKNLRKKSAYVQLFEYILGGVENPARTRSEPRPGKAGHGEE
jgi:hypothetical protein